MRPPTCRCSLPEPSEPQQPSPPVFKVPQPTLPAAPFWAAAGSEAIAGVFACLLCIVSRLPILGPRFSLSPRAIVFAALTAIPFSFAFWLLEEALPTGITEATETLFRNFFYNRSSIDIFIFCLCVALGEELLFRAWMLAGFIAWGVKPTIAVAISSIIFGVLHSYTAIYMIMATFAGSLFGLMFVSSGTVLHPVIVHFLYDFCTILFMKRKWRKKFTT